MRQTKTGGKKQDKERCASCGITEPHHMGDCPTVNFELFTARLDEKKRYDEEKVVSREMGRRILAAIKLMLSTPKDKDGKPTKIYFDRKKAILEEINNL